MVNDVTYEALLGRVKSLGIAAHDRSRTIVWCDVEKRVGVARDTYGRLEIFLVGPAIAPRSPSLVGAIEHQEWHRESAEPVAANRLLLPSPTHFDEIAAFVCTELLRNGASSDPVGAFRRTEPIISLVLERMRIDQSVVLGLFGELLVLEAVLDNVQPERVPQMLGTWFGYIESARDFQFDHVGVEVKTTVGAASRHPVQGVHQVEVGHGVHGVVENEFFLLSIGIAPASAQDGSSLPQIVDRIVDRVIGAGCSDDLASTFIARVCSYGGERAIGYDHNSMAGDVVFQQPWRASFARVYDMTDPAVSVLRSDDVAPRGDVVLDSVRFTVSLREHVTGDLNPIVGLQRGVKAMLSRVSG